MQFANNQRWGYELYASTVGGKYKVAFGIWSGTSAAVEFLGGNDGKWHQIAGRKTATQIELFVDGSRKAVASHSLGSVSAPGLALVMGGFEGMNWGDFDGRIDNVRIYNRRLNDLEVGMLASGPGPGTPPPPTRTESYEAESGTLSGAAGMIPYLVVDPLASAGKAVAGTQGMDAAVSIAGVDGGGGGLAAVVVRHACGDSSGTIRRTIYVNGVKATKVVFPYTGGFAGAATSSYKDLLVPVVLPAGAANVLMLRRDADDPTVGADLDKLTITVAP
jgi:hypothetical protein